MTEYEANVTDGYRQDPFTGEVTNIGVEDVGGYNKVIIEFTDGPNLSIFPPKEINDGDVPGYMDLGIFIQSLKELNISTFISVDDETLELDGIRTEPDIGGMTCDFDVKPKEWVNNQGETKTNYEWRVTKAESNGTPAPKPEKSPAKESKPGEPTEDSTDQTALWEEIILDVLSNGSMSEGGIMKAMKLKVTDKAEQKKMNDVRRATIEAMASDSIIKKEGNEFVLV